MPRNTRDRLVFPVLLLGPLAALTAIAAIGGCEENGIFIGSNCWHDGEQLLDPACCPCPLPEDCPDGPKPIPAGCPNAPPPDAGADGSTDGGMTQLCAGGTCVPPAPQDWLPVAFSSTWAGEPVACPPDAPILVFEGQPAPPPPACGACSCDPPEGTCALPATWTVSSASCANPGAGVKTSFDPPSGWDGSCNGDSAILGGKLCGGVPCVRSITVQPPVITELSCEAVTTGDPEDSLPRAWSGGGPDMPIGVACMSDQPAPACAEPGMVCVPGGAAFSACVFQEGDNLCPEGWADRHLLYGHIEDNRTCSDCECGAPSGGTCQALYSIFSGPACSPLEAAGTVSTGMIDPCHDFMPGAALLSKSAEVLAYTKGSCLPSGGDVAGDLFLDEPATVCCWAPII